MHSVDVGIPDRLGRCWNDEKIMFSFYQDCHACIHKLVYTHLHMHNTHTHLVCTHPQPLPSPHTHTPTTHTHRTSYFLPQTVSRLTPEENQLAHMTGNISLTTSSSRRRTPRLARTMFPLSRRHHPRTPRWVNCE